MKRLMMVTLILALGLPLSGCAIRYARPGHAAAYHRPPGHAHGHDKNKNKRDKRNKQRGQGHGNRH